MGCNDVYCKRSKYIEIVINFFKVDNHPLFLYNKNQPKRFSFETNT